MTPFAEKIMDERGERLQAREISTVQVNVGYRCNQACRHCHIAANPDRQEIMSKETMDIVLSVMKKHDLRHLDITGGAPELNPHFKYFVETATGAGIRVTARTNLTVFFETGIASLPEFYRDHRVEIIASLPCYTQTNVDSLRGDKVFEKSIAAIHVLNTLGYGNDTVLILDLVYNPGHAFLPGNQEALQIAYKKELQSQFGITFNRLLVIANMPIGRFRESLCTGDELSRYMNAAQMAFNPGTIEGLMCRTLLNVGWDGALYDCDFNQALGIPVKKENPRYIMDFQLSALQRRFIATGDHCYICTAGAGSS